MDEEALDYTATRTPIYADGTEVGYREDLVFDYDPIPRVSLALNGACAVPIAEGSMLGGLGFYAPDRAVYRIAIARPNGPLVDEWHAIGNGPFTRGGAYIHGPCIVTVTRLPTAEELAAAVNWVV